MRISTSGLRAGSLFKFLWIGNLCGWLPIFILSGVSAVFGFGTVTFNGKPVEGPLAIPVVAVMWPLFAALMSCLQWLLFALGYWLYGWWGKLTLELKNAAAD